MATLRSLNPRVRPIAEWFLRYLASIGIKAMVTSARRDKAQQAKLYADYRAGRAAFPAAPPGKSTHAAGIAFDLRLANLAPPASPPYPWQYQTAGELWESLGLTWGGRFGDPIHFDFRRRA